MVLFFFVLEEILQLFTIRMFARAQVEKSFVSNHILWVSGYICVNKIHKKH